MESRRHHKSAELLSRSSKVLAGGVSSEFRKGNHPHALFYSHGKGSRIYDVDGNEYLDFTLSQGPLILGHSHPDVLNAVNEYSQHGQLFAGQHIKEIELAEKLQNIAHLDLSMNAIEWNRDLSRPLDDVRMREMHMKDKPDRGKGTVTLPELRRGHVGLVVATQLSRCAMPGSALPGWNSPQQAWAMTQAQLAWYKEMETLGEMVQIMGRTELDRHLELWGNSDIPVDDKPIGYILSLEGADSLVKVSYLEKAYAYGLRAVGLSHFGHGRYAPGTRSEGPITSLGFDLMREMKQFNMILDITHLTEEGFDQALDFYDGPVWASHHNVRKICPTQRQLSDHQIKRLIERGSVVGGMLDCWAMDIRFIDAVSDPWQLDIQLENLIDHWDHICQIAGNADHVAIGSDLDGIFGVEQCPWDMNSIADLQKFADLLLKRGYTESDVRKIFSENWLSFLRKAWG